MWLRERQSMRSMHLLNVVRGDVTSQTCSHTTGTQQMKLNEAVWKENIHWTMQCSAVVFKMVCICIPHMSMFSSSSSHTTVTQESGSFFCCVFIFFYFLFSCFFFYLENIAVLTLHYFSCACFRGSHAFRLFRHASCESQIYVYTINMYHFYWRTLIAYSFLAFVSFVPLSCTNPHQ